MMNIPGKQLAEAPMRDIFNIKYSLHHYKYTPPVHQQWYVNVRKGRGLSVNCLVDFKRLLQDRLCKDGLLEQDLPYICHFTFYRCDDFSGLPEPCNLAVICIS